MTIQTTSSIQFADFCAALRLALPDMPPRAVQICRRTRSTGTRISIRAIGRYRLPAGLREVAERVLVGQTDDGDEPTPTIRRRRQMK